MYINGFQEANKDDSTENLDMNAQQQSSAGEQSVEREENNTHSSKSDTILENTTENSTTDKTQSLTNNENNGGIDVEGQIICGLNNEKSKEKLSQGDQDSDERLKPSLIFPLEIKFPLNIDDDGGSKEQPEFYNETLEWDLGNSLTPSPMEFALEISRQYGLSYCHTLDLSNSIEAQINTYINNNMKCDSTLKTNGLSEKEKSTAENNQTTSKSSEGKSGYTKLRRSRRSTSKDLTDTQRKAQLCSSSADKNDAVTSKVDNSSTSNKKGKRKAQKSFQGLIDLVEEAETMFSSSTTNMRERSRRRRSERPLNAYQRQKAIRDAKEKEQSFRRSYTPLPPLAKCDEILQIVGGDFCEIIDNLREDSKGKAGICELLDDHVCHICRQRKPKVVRFGCGVHAFCDKHCSQRLGASTKTVVTKPEEYLCPVCCLTCICAPCKRNLSAAPKKVRSGGVSLDPKNRTDDDKFKLLKISSGLEWSDEGPVKNALKKRQTIPAVQSSRKRRKSDDHPTPTVENLDVENNSLSSSESSESTESLFEQSDGSLFEETKSFTEDDTLQLESKADSKKDVLLEPENSVVVENLNMNPEVMSEEISEKPNLDTNPTSDSERSKHSLSSFASSSQVTSANNTDDQNKPSSTTINNEAVKTSCDKNNSSETPNSSTPTYTSDNELMDSKETETDKQSEPLTSETVEKTTNTDEIINRVGENLQSLINENKQLIEGNDLFLDQDALLSTSIEEPNITRQGNSSETNSIQSLDKSFGDSLSFLPQDKSGSSHCKKSPISHETSIAPVATHILKNNTDDNTNEENEDITFFSSKDSKDPTSFTNNANTTEIQKMPSEIVNLTQNEVTLLKEVSEETVVPSLESMSKEETVNDVANEETTSMAQWQENISPPENDEIPPLSPQNDVSILETSSDKVNQSVLNNMSEASIQGEVSNAGREKEHSTSQQEITITNLTQDDDDNELPLQANNSDYGEAQDENIINESLDVLEDLPLGNMIDDDSSKLTSIETLSNEAMTNEELCKQKSILNETSESSSYDMFRNEEKEIQLSTPSTESTSNLDKTIVDCYQPESTEEKHVRNEDCSHENHQPSATSKTTQTVTGEAKISEQPSTEEDQLVKTQDVSHMLADKESSTSSKEGCGSKNTSCATISTEQQEVLKTTTDSGLKSVETPHSTVFEESKPPKEQNVVCHDTPELSKQKPQNQSSAYLQNVRNVEDLTCDEIDLSNSEKEHPPTHSKNEITPDKPNKSESPTESNKEMRFIKYDEMPHKETSISDTAEQYPVSPEKTVLVDSLNSCETYKIPLAAFPHKVYNNCDVDSSSEFNSGILKDNSTDLNNSDEKSGTTEGTHIDYCMICRDEQGDLIYCSKCPRAFHAKCVSPDKVTMSDTWLCHFCIRDNNQEEDDILSYGSSVQSVVSALSLVIPPDLEFPACVEKIEILAKIHAMLMKLTSFDFGYLFRQPINIDDIPSYSNIIDQPMDLGTIVTNIENGSYIKRICDRRNQFTQESKKCDDILDVVIINILEDVELVWHNFFLYSPKGSVTYRMALVQRRKYTKLRKINIDGRLKSETLEKLKTVVDKYYRVRSKKNVTFKGVTKKSASHDTLEELNTGLFAHTFKGENFSPTTDDENIAVYDQENKKILKVYSSIQSAASAAMNLYERGYSCEIKDFSKDSFEDFVEKNRFDRSLRCFGYRWLNHRELVNKDKVTHHNVYAEEETEKQKLRVITPFDKKKTKSDRYVKEMNDYVKKLVVEERNSSKNEAVSIAQSLDVNDLFPNIGKHHDAPSKEPSVSKIDIFSGAKSYYSNVSLAYYDWIATRKESMTNFEDQDSISTFTHDYLYGDHDVDGIIWNFTRLDNSE